MAKPFVAIRTGCIIIGLVKRDIHKREKSLEQQFPMETPSGIIHVLENIHALRSARLSGDLDASILLMDFMDAYKNTGLSYRESQVIWYLYEHQLTQQETAEALGISRDSINKYVRRAAKKLARTIKLRNGGTVTDR